MAASHVLIHGHIKLECKQLGTWPALHDTLTKNTWWSMGTAIGTIATTKKLGHFTTVQLVFGVVLDNEKRLNTYIYTL